MRTLLASLVLALLAACAQPEQVPARPALWQVTGPQGEQGWLFGTIHALRQPYDWQTPRFNAALAKADRIVVEVAGLNRSDVIARTFAELARTPGQPALNSRVPAAQRPALERLMLRTQTDDARFADVETWAAALTLARAADPEQDTSLGVDRAILKLAGTRPVEELEGAAAQLRIFDALPEAEQRDLLGATVAEASTTRDPDALARDWANGDIARLEAETQRGLLADPELRAALLVQRNRAWASRIAAMLASKQRPFVAVGAAHLVGAEGLPALLAAQGYAVVRVQ
jgi:uncharacterized protein